MAVGKEPPPGGGLDKSVKATPQSDQPTVKSVWANGGASIATRSFEQILEN